MFLMESFELIFESKFKMVSLDELQVVLENVGLEFGCFLGGVV